MPTGHDLSTLLRRGFAQATADLDPTPDLVHIVRRRHLTARTRRRIVAVAVPAAALAAGTGFALAGRNIPNHPAVAVPPPSAPTTSVAAPRTTQVTSVPMKPASYKVVLKDHSAPPNCPANATAPVGKSENPAGVWYWTENGTCVFIGVGWADTKPPNAAPVQIDGYPGLYGTLENGVRTIYAPVAPGTNDFHPRGGWVVLTVSANAPRELVVRLILVPAN
jgi:hypothetical protein